jgi:eukaryotic-like serine/threonine-protein kinase
MNAHRPPVFDDDTTLHADTVSAEEANAPASMNDSGVRSPRRELVEGDLVGGAYHVEAELGRGGTGVVYRAKDVWLGRTAALKLVHAFTSESAAHERLQKEAKTLASVRSPHVVEVYAFGRHGESYFFAMEYVRGRSLAALLDEYRERGARLPVHRVVTVLARIAAGLDAVHGARLVHRDVKPANIVIEDDTGRPVLVDFSLAVPHDLGGGGRWEGTPHYMAPEQFRAQAAEIGPHTDLYALGCVAYEMLTGKPPFPAATLGEIAVAHCDAPPPKVSAERPDLAPFDALIARALAKAPADRYPNGASFARDLSITCTSLGMGGGSMPPPAPESRGPTTRENRALRVLTVDDDPAFRRFAAKAVNLAMSGAPLSSTTASSGGEAIAFARENQFDLVLLDLDMPELDGIETLSLLRALPGGEQARVVVLSGSVGAQERWRFSILGVRDFVPKPVDFPRLVEKLTAIVERAGWLTQT